MKKYMLKLMADGEELLKSGKITKDDVYDFERHIAYCCHERIVHLFVTLAFAVMTILSIMIMLMFEGIGVMLLALIFAVMTAAYVWHYYFLENSVQHMYEMADEMHKICEK